MFIEIVFSNSMALLVFTLPSLRKSTNHDKERVPSMLTGPCPRDASADEDRYEDKEDSHGARWPLALEGMVEMWGAWCREISKEDTI